MFRFHQPTVCDMRRNVPVYALKRPFNESNSKHIDHFNKVNELSKSKKIMHSKLDKHINMAFTYCNDDKHTLICKIIWEDVHECLRDIDNINHEIQYHKWYMFIDEE